MVTRVEPLPFPTTKVLEMDMEKHGVEKDDSKTKTASVTSGSCPRCGKELTKENGVYIEHCPYCGTFPFEKRPPASAPDTDSE